MSVFGEAFAKTMGHEGGYANDPNDAGGETYRGVARNANPNWRGWVLVDAMRARPDFPRCLDGSTDLQLLVEDVYKRLYWDRWQGDNVPHAGIAMELFDTSVNMGVGKAVTFLQQGLNALNKGGRLWEDVVEDGDLGPKTMLGLRRCIDRGDGDLLLVAMNALQGARYLEIMKRNPSQEAYARGWLRRVQFGRI